MAEHLDWFEDGEGALARLALLLHCYLLEAVEFWGDKWSFSCLK